MTVTVVKLGGSLSTSDLLPDWLDQIEQLAKRSNIVLVPGGGQFAEQVRQQQRTLGYGDLTAHRLALLGMCQTGYFLKEKCPALSIVCDSGKLAPFLNKGLPLLWLPLELLDDQSEVPASWDYTSDSIALWLAGRLHAEQLILVKKALPEGERNLINYINNHVIDKGFQKLIANIESKILVLAGSEWSRLAASQDMLSAPVPVPAG